MLVGVGTLVKYSPRCTAPILNAAAKIEVAATFVASANFVAGTSGAANVAGATAFREDARSAAKKANLTKAQTKKLLDTVEAAIAKSKAKAKNKVLAKLKKKK